MSSNHKCPLSDLLMRHPWISRDLLLRIIPQSINLDELLKAEDGTHKNRRQKLAAYGDCYALKDETPKIWSDVDRLSMVRRFALLEMSPEAFFTGMSPGFISDGFFCWNNQNWRFWADLGEIAVEALPFVRNPPTTFAPEIIDVVIVPNERRQASVSSQILLNWGGGRNVRVWDWSSSELQEVKPINFIGTKWKPPTHEKTVTYFRNRMKEAPAATDAVWNKLPEMDEMDWSLLVAYGNNPFLSVEAMAHLKSDPQPVKVGGHRENRQRWKYSEVYDRIESLISRQLLHSPKGAEFDGLYILTWKSIKLLSLRWNVSIEDMGRFHPWPMTTEKGKRLEYSTKWAVRLHQHQSWCKQFSMSLLLGGRSVSNGLGRARVNVVTMIASRIVYKEHSLAGAGDIRWVVPDGFSQISIDRYPWNDGLGGEPKTICSHDLLIEIDHATNPLNRLDGRLESYAKIWWELKPWNPLLIWVIDGSPYREHYLLEKMRERKLDGYTVLLERLILPENDAWWMQRPLMGNAKKMYRIVGGMAPYRKVWMSTGTGTEMVSFVGHTPWENRELIRKSRPTRLPPTYSVGGV